MVTFLIRRLIGSALVVLLSTFVMYILVDLSIDPLSDLYSSTAPNREAQIATRIAALRLDEPVVVRYWDWLQGVSGCAVGQCDLGVDWRVNQPVTEQLVGAVAATFQLVTAAATLAILLGIGVGVVSALRQYSGFDYSITFLSFLLYSLPVFWVAVLAKAFIAIDFNDFLVDPTLSAPVLVGVGALAGLALSGAVGGTLRRRLATGVVAAAVTFGLGTYLNLTDWFTRPSEGNLESLLLIALSGVGAAFVVTTLSTGLAQRRSLYAALTVVGIGVALYFPMLMFWNAVSPSWPIVLGLGLLTVAAGLGVGLTYSGPDRWRSARTAAITAFLMGSMLFVDRIMQSWYAYTNNPSINGRPIATIGSETPSLEGSFWIHTIDRFTHLLLPSITLILISFAAYTRYVRASMLEVLNADYIRTARAKGLTERTVVMRHAFRNALLPLASIVPVDLITLIGGAVITEQVFGWFGMGRLFVDSLSADLQDPVMAYILIVGIFAVLANLIADLAYAVLDPRIRVRA